MIKLALEKPLTNCDAFPDDKFLLSPLFTNRKINIGTDMGKNHLIRHTKHEKRKDLIHNISKSTIDSNLFSIVLHVCNLTDFAKLHMSSVHLEFTYRTPPRLIKAKKSPCYVLRYVNINIVSFYPKITAFLLFPKLD